jgi:hypothetical protein
MSALVLDTLKFSKKLREAGFEEKQADVMAEAIADVVESELVIKRDLKEMELAFQKNLADTKAELIRWVVGMSFLQISLITALLLKIN